MCSEGYAPLATLRIFLNESDDSFRHRNIPRPLNKNLRLKWCMEISLEKERISGISGVSAVSVTTGLPLH